MLPLFFLTGNVTRLLGQTPSVKLTGTIIGTTPGYDYTLNMASTTVGMPKDAFDGNLNTAFASNIRTGGWAGLDLGIPCIITKIAYCPREETPDRMSLGVFEGANNADFGDAIPLYMITDTPSIKTMTSKDISCTKGFRYIRYIGPNNAKSNVAELEFYGYPAIGDNTTLPQITNLPTVNIHTTNAEDIVSKEIYLKGILSIVSGDGKNLFSDSLEIKGRGNASWELFPKKPYRIKLYHKASLAGLPAKEKSWTLINNYGDKTLMRNLLAFDMSKRLEMPYTPSGTPVDVFLNGEFKGCYQLCDQIEVKSDRINITEMKKDDISGETLTGGYLIEMDAYAAEEKSMFTSNKSVPVTIKSPDDDEIVSTQSQYIKSHFNLMEATLYGNVTSGINNYLDVPTFVRHFLVGEFTGNTDTYWSTYMYKKRNDEKFYFGPVWDFDLAYENDSRTYPIKNLTNWIYCTKGSAAPGVKEMVDKMLTSKLIQSQLKSVYAAYRKNGILSETELFKVVDDYATTLGKSQKLNFQRWNIMNTIVHQNPIAWGSYTAEVNNVKNYIRNRIAWMDKKLGYITDLKKDDLSEIRLWTETNILHIEGFSDPATIQIFDLTGRAVLTAKATGPFTTSLRQGSYIVRISDKTAGNKTLKCIIP
jgi:CotH protein.